MTPRAVRPARARKCAAGLSEARLALRVTRTADAEVIPVSTSPEAGQTLRTTGRRHPLLPRATLLSVPALAAVLLAVAAVTPAVAAVWQVNRGVAPRRRLWAAVPANGLTGKARVRRPPAARSWSAADPVPVGGTSSGGRADMASVSTWERIERQKLRRRERRIRRYRPGDRPDSSRPAGTD